MTSLTKAQKRKLQGLIDRCGKAHDDAYRAQKALNNFSMEIWGVAPSDVDADYIIDAVLGGCGMSSHLPVEEFITEMERAT